MTLLEVSHLHKRFNDTPAVDDVSLRVDPGQILCLLGPSGSGKTTLLRIIAGLEVADQGQVRLEGQDISAVPPHRRDFGLMFQEFALFPHKNVFDNVAFGLRSHGSSPPAVSGRVEEMLALVDLAGFGPRDVNELSGGERQRVALARSLAPKPRLLMLDEPLGSLDRALRERLTLELRRILKRVGLAALYVTHDQTEAFAVADLVAVLNQGRIEQIAPPEALYCQPATQFVARFLGFHNLLAGTVLAPNQVRTSLGVIAMNTTGAPTNQPVTVLLRPEAAVVLDNQAPVSAAALQVQGVVQERFFRGQTYRLRLQTGSAVLVFDLPNGSPPPLPGQPVRLALHPEAMVLLAADS
jgi:ABC-type Fe3+/spermidine/putrescine transport system ATPase subunit